MNPGKVENVMRGEGYFTMGIWKGFWEEGPWSQLCGQGVLPANSDGSQKGQVQRPGGKVQSAFGNGRGGCRGRRLCAGWAR